MTVERDEHGCALCPICDPTEPIFGDCEEGDRGLFLEVEHTVPIDLDASYTAVNMDEVGFNSVTSRWRVVCVSGHVLAVSKGEEHAEDFTIHDYLVSVSDQPLHASDDQ